MKILHVIPSVSEVRGGPTEALRVTTRALALQGLDIHVATTDDDGPQGRRPVPQSGILLRDGVILHFFPRQTSFYSFSLPLTMWLWSHVREFDVVHIHALFNYPALAAGVICNLRGVPYILRPLGTMARWGFVTRRPLLKRLSFSLAEGPLLARAAAVHCTSEMEREDCAGYRTVVIPNPVEMRPTAVPAAAVGKTVLFLGRLDPIKGLEFLLSAFVQVLAAIPDAHLLIAGDGTPEFVAQLKAQARSLLPDAAVTFTGFLKGDMRDEAWQEAALFVLPSRTENFGISVVEAMERGLAVVISDQVGIWRDVEAHDAGLVVPCAAGPLAHALIRLLRDPELRAAMGVRGRAAADELYSPSSVAKALSSLYQSIMRETESV